MCIAYQFQYTYATLVNLNFHLLVKIELHVLYHIAQLSETVCLYLENVYFVAVNKITEYVSSMKKEPIH